MTVIEYVTEEVIRQGHDVRALDGIERVGWMLNAWSHALRRLAPPTFLFAIELGKLVEPFVNHDGLRLYKVWVGNRRCPDFHELDNLLHGLFKRIDTLTPLEFYKEFELIHPFGDGNGRTGKILLNYLNDTLLHPIFPPDDLFGYSIKNP